MYALNLFTSEAPLCQGRAKLIEEVHLFFSLLLKILEFRIRKTNTLLYKVVEAV